MNCTLPYVYCHGMLTANGRRPMADFGPSLGQLWPSFATLGQLWADFGATLAQLWADFADSLPTLDRNFGLTLRRLWADFGGPLFYVKAAA